MVLVKIPLNVNDSFDVKNHDDTESYASKNTTDDQSNIDDDDVIIDHDHNLENENYDSTSRLFSPFSQLDGNDDLLEQEIEIVSGSKTKKRYIFWIKLKNTIHENVN